jgi:hypothetical protein
MNAGIDACAELYATIAYSIRGITRHHSQPGQHESEYNYALTTKHPNPTISTCAAQASKEHKWYTLHNGMCIRGLPNWLRN